VINNTNYSEIKPHLTIKEKNSWAIWLLYAFTIIPTFLPVGIDSVLMGCFVFFPLLIWSFSSQEIPKYLSYITLPLAGIILIGLVGFLTNPSFDVIKDIWYVGNAMLTLLAGFILMNILKDFRRLSTTFVLAGSFVSLLHVLKFAVHPEYLFLPTNEMRAIAGGGNLSSILGVGLLLVFWALKTPLFDKHKWMGYLAFGICLASIALSSSRESIISLVVLVACIYGWIDFYNTKRLIKVTVAILLLVSVVLILPTPQPVTQNPTLIEKILHSANELKVQDYRSIQSINNNWRGYETARALKTYKDGEYWQYVVGRGFGTSVDLGLYIKLGEDMIRFAPILHNGYMYLLVKTGALGLMLYLLMLVLLIRLGTNYSHKTDPESQYTGRLIVGMSFVIFLSTYVISGLLNKQALISVALLTGALVAHASNLSLFTLQESKETNR
jgi:hypothetical protein